MNNSIRQSREKLLKLVTLAILTAIVILLQQLGSFIHIGPTSVTLVLVPIVIGACLVGPSGGLFLGFVFGAMTLWAGISGTDGFTNLLFSTQPVETAVICLGKAMLAGLGSGLVYKALRSKEPIIASFFAAAVAPIINTGLFILGGLTLVSSTLSSNFLSEGTTLVYFLIIGCAGLNFVAEFIVNIVLAPVINTVVTTVRKTK